MEFNKAYNRQEFVSFLQNSFLPDDFIPGETSVEFRTKMNYTRQAVKLGSSDTLDLVVYEVRHNSKNDARVSLSKEAFRLLAEEMEDRALVIFVPEDNSNNYRFSLIEITLEAKDDSSRVTRNYSNPRRYSYFLGEGIAYYTPNKYLNEKGRVVNPDDLRSRFSVEVLTKEFYQELSDWYAWAIKIIRFPNDLNDKTDDDKFNNESAIRLITRLIFVWFLKQRHLIPEEFFDEDYLREKLLKNFKPYQMEGLLHDVGEVKYYTAILQNLFFAMLNSPITPEGSTVLSERHFRKLNEQGKPDGSDRDNNKLMRYESYFKNPQLFVDLANRTVPFLNGGLFDCLDDKDNKIYYDGFSDNEKSKKSLYLPDFLFFIPEADVDLSVWYNDKKKKKAKVRGLIQILKRYNFTVEENTPFDQEVSLDPELLGKVFENLLASYNPETQTTARKQTGSFYTPREIVQYMVDESLVAHLKRTVGDELEEQYRQLMRYTDEEVLLTDAQRKQIMQSLYHCKVLDPACGSGAFPMGMLQQMVHILNRIDPDNEMWKEMMRQAALCKQDLEQDEIQEVEDDLNRNFNDGFNRPDYARKLYLIENCIYGVDIQPIAIQISKLRFFISLVVDQKANDNPAENFGIRPLPNLEAKFVAANTLIGLDKKDSSLFDTPEILAKKEELKIAKHKIFGAKTVRTKRKYKDAVNRIRQEIAELLRSMGAIGESEAAVLASWDMFDQNASSPFFDPEWMFDVKEGFDIVIGNPPYGISIKGEYRKTVVREFGNVPDYEIYYYFIECAQKQLQENGILSYIIPNTWLFNTYAINYRQKVLNNWNIIEILDCTQFPIFDSATVLNSIIILGKADVQHFTTIGYRNTSKALCFKDLLSRPRSYISIPNLIELNQNWGLAFSRPLNVIQLINKIKHNKTHLINIFPEISQGLIAYDKYRGQSSDIIRNRAYHSFEYKAGLKKWLWGEDVKRYSVQWNGKEYIDYCAGIANPRDPKFFKEKRLLVREITNPSIFATLTSEELYNDPAIIIVLDNKDCSYPLEVILAILNSKLATFYHFNHSPKATKGAFPKILVMDIKQFPLPVLTENTKKNIISLVDKQNTEVTEANDIALDILVYHLYGLTYDEVLIVDPQTPITREEYENNI